MTKVPNNNTLIPALRLGLNKISKQKALGVKLFFTNMPLKYSLILLLLFNSFINKAQTYPSLNVNLLAHINPEKDNTGNDGRKYSGCWGWFQATKNKEYALVGTSSKTYFIDVTNPSNPIICDSVKARNNGCTWREIKSYQNYCYIASDGCTPSSCQIVDMQYLPDSVHVVYDDTTLFYRAHTLFVDKDKLYAGGPTMYGTGTKSMFVYSLATPSVPVLIRKLEQDIPSITYVHDMFVKNDTIYASAGWQGLQIIKLNANNTFSLLASYANYQNAGYNHSSWLTSNSKYLAFADEVPASLPLKLIDVSDLNNIQSLATVNSHSLATPHNPYIMDNKWCWVSSYQEGLRLFDISNPALPTEYGFFDTCPLYGNNDNFATAPYKGNWGAYPYLPSKIIIACDMQNGVFILEGDNNYKNTVVSINENKKETSLFSVYPNPANEMLNLHLITEALEATEIIISNTFGDVILKQTVSIQNLKLNIQNLSSGLYFVTLSNKELQETQKIVIQH